MITLEGGNIQNCGGIGIPDGSITLQLNVDATVIATPFGFVAAAVPVTFQFDSDGNLVQPAKLWSNKELNPQNDVGLGTYYLVTLYDANGARVNQTPMWWQFTEVNGDTVDISALTPFATVGGNVIFYPTSFAIPAPTLIALGGVFANPGAAHKWVSAINTDGSVTLSQPAFTDISGQITQAQLPSPLIFTSLTLSGLLTAQAGIDVGNNGIFSGEIIFEGGTSGTCTITAPAIAGTITNPFSFSNGINIPSGAIFSINTDTGISRDSAGVIDVGNGTAGDVSGTIKAAHLALGNPLPVSSGGNGTSSPSIVAGAGISVTGSWPAQTVSASVTGVPITIQTINLATQGFAVFNTAATVNLLTSATAGTYRISVYLVVTTLFVTNTSETITIGWTDDHGAETLAVTAASVSAGTIAVGSQLIRVNGGSTVSYTPSVAGGTASAGAASFSIVLERLI